MRAKWALLFKIQWMGLTGINKARHAGGRTGRRLAITAAAVGLVAAMLIFLVAMLALSFCRAGLGGMLPAFSVAAASLAVFVFSLLRGPSLLFAAKDLDFTLALPVTRRAVVAARLLCSYAVNALFTLIVALPAAVVYFVCEGFSWTVLGTLALALPCAPLLPLAVAAALGTGVAALSARLKHKNLLQSVLGIALFFGAMAASFAFSFGANADTGALYNALVKFYPPALLVAKTANEGAAWGVFAFAGASLAAAALFVWAAGACFTQIASALAARAAGTGYKRGDVRASSAFAALVKREFKRLFSSSAYLLNAAAGVLLLLLGAVALLFFDIGAMAGELPVPQRGGAGDLFACMGAGVMAVMQCMSCPSASALSLEGKSRGLLFSLPVSAGQILLAKAVPTFALDAGAGLLFAASLCRSCGAGAAVWALCMAGAVLFAAMAAAGGIFLNAKFPKYDWKQEVQVVKNSLPVTVTVFAGMAFGIGVAVLTVFAGVWALAAACAVSLLLCALALAALPRRALHWEA